jgi:hypothetical protein
MHPIYAALLQRPDLLAGHLLAYGDLMQMATRQLARALRIRLGAAVLGLAAAALAFIWGGMALMLAVMLERQHTLLWWLPVGALLAALIAALLAMRPLPTAMLSELKAQLEEDADALRLLDSQA